MCGIPNQNIIEFSRILKRILTELVKITRGFEYVVIVDFISTYQQGLLEYLVSRTNMRY